jgi:hypothetical protein
LVILDFSSRKKVADLAAQTDQISGAIQGYDWVFTPNSRYTISTEIGAKGELVFWDFAHELKPRYFPIEGEPMTAMAKFWRPAAVLTKP